jgi:hypothetical protein
MLVYGDHKQIADPRERLTRVGDELAILASMPAGIERHAKLVGALIEAGQIQQGVEDEGCQSAELSRFVYALAACVLRSWDSRYSEIGDVPEVPRTRLPRAVELRLPEGFAFYAVYPEQFIEAARGLQLRGAPRVIGIRSIGTTLGAVVAAALNAPPPDTVRPLGDPFARQAELPPWIVENRTHYVIVDEGPGLSGSSFGAVADWLEARGVPLERIAFLPSHDGDPGSKASDAHRVRWRKAQRVPAPFDPAILRDTVDGLEPFSTGSPWERLKFRAAWNGEPVLLKFAGLGAIGECKLAMARALHAGAFTPEPLGLLHGFLVERWLADAQPLATNDNPVEEIGRYIGARAKLFPAAGLDGASIKELLAMARRNIELALGAGAQSALDSCDVDALQLRVHRVRTDNQLDRDQWLRLRDGRLIKTDALDHHQGHDLIGCQDAAWDVAGAVVEFGLDDDGTAALIAATRLFLDRSLLDFYLICYCAFRAGQTAIAAAMSQAAATKCRAPNRYTHHLSLLLQRTRCGTRQKSLVD